MKLKQLFIISSVAIIACLLCISCVKVNYPERTQFMLNIQKPKPLYTKSQPRTIVVRSVVIVPQVIGELSRAQ